jgi:hypothetical protein
LGFAKKTPAAYAADRIIKTINQTVMTTLLDSATIYPSVSIVMRLEKAFTGPKKNKEKLNNYIKEIGAELQQRGPEDTALEIMKRLEEVAKQTDLSAFPESIGIYISKTEAKVIPLPFPAKEGIAVDHRFRIRDLLYASKTDSSCLVLVLSGNTNKLFLLHGTELTVLQMPGAPENADATKIDLPSKVGNFSDAHHAFEVNFEKYLRGIDHALTEVIKEFKLPVVICCVTATAGHLKTFTRNAQQIIGYVEGNFVHSNSTQLIAHIRPLLEKRAAHQEQEIIARLEEATNRNHCASGIHDVWLSAQSKRGRLLVVEKDYSCAGRARPGFFSIVTDPRQLGSPEVTKDAVNDLMEMVLESGGDVSFVDNGALAGYGQIALITYY